jgi:thiamine-phosphate pyrophosphorylase
VSIPRLHLTTDDAVLAGPDFTNVAGALLSAHGGDLALHVRGPATMARRLLEIAESLVPVAEAAGAMLLVNDRVDVALAAGATGVQLGSRSIPPADARPLLGDRIIGCSAHSAEGAEAVSRWIDFLFLGTIYPTPSHPDDAGGGPALVAAAAARTTVPILAIGGVTTERVAEVVAAGAHGVAVIRGVWAPVDPVAAARRYLDALNVASRARSRAVRE